MPNSDAQHPQKAIRRNLSVEPWSIVQPSRGICVDGVQLPTHLHPELVRAGHIPDPLFADNELAVAWVDDEPWTFSLEFDWSPSEDLPQTRLEFGGLDTIATIRLNGHLLGETRNMWIPFVAEVRQFLVDGVNRLDVDFQPAKAYGEQRRVEWMGAHGFPLTTSGFEERCFVRKAQYSFGWDWGPRLISCGIWRAVELINYAALIDEVSVQQVHDQGRVAVTMATTPRPEHRVQHQIFEAETHELVGEVEGDGTIVLNSPKLWHPENPHLYRLVTTIFDEDASVLDSREFPLGLREVSIRMQDTPSGTTFEFIVNGQPIWARGANWIPAHSFMTPHLSARQRVQDAKDMQMNMLRVWGGGLMDPDDFYSACDELGVLVWQDFPYACGYYPDDEAAQQECEQESRAIISRLAHHPCIAIWCGNNENEMMFQGKWGGAENTPERYVGEPLYCEVIPRVHREMNCDVPYIPGSPHGREPDCNSPSSGDQHFWDVWHGVGDWTYYHDFRGSFCSEFGFLSSCGRLAWSGALPPGVDSATDPLVEFHNRSNKPSYFDLIALHYHRPRTLEELIYASQLNQRDAMRSAIEHMRFSDFCRGALIWQLNDCWPVQSWSLVDSAGEWKAAAHEVKALFGDIMVRAKRDGERLVVGILNSRTCGVVDELVVRGESFSGQNWTAVRQIAVEPGASAVAELELPMQTDVVVLNYGGVRSLRLLVEPKDVPQVAGPLTLTRTGDYKNWSFQAECILVDIWLSLRLPLPELVRSDGLLTGEVMEIPYRGEPVKSVARSLAGVHEVEWRLE